MNAVHMGLINNRIMFLDVVVLILDPKDVGYYNFKIEVLIFILLWV